MAGLPQISSIRTPDKSISGSSMNSRGFGSMGSMGGKFPIPFFAVAAVLVVYGLVVC